MNLLNAITFAVVFLSGLYFAGLGVLSIADARRATLFLGSFASSALAHYVEPYRAAETYRLSSESHYPGHLSMDRYAPLFSGPIICRLGVQFIAPSIFGRIRHERL